MVRITPCISVVIQRKAVKNQALLEKWIKEDEPSFFSYDEDLICMTIAMNPYDAKRAIESLNRRLGILIYDESNPDEPVAKDGVVVERMFGFGAPCNWLRREKDRNYLSFIPEEERRPMPKAMEYDPSKDIVIRDFGEYKGQPLVLMESRYVFYLKLGTARRNVPITNCDDLTKGIIRGISKEDAVLFLEDKDGFCELIDERIQTERRKEADRQIYIDVGEAEGTHYHIAKGRYGNYIRCIKGEERINCPLPKEYKKDDELCRTLNFETVLSFVKDWLE